jgi:hypothetical protein
MSVAEFALTDAAILAEIERREPSILATNYGLIDAGPFGTLATIIANRAFGELSLASADESLWLMGPRVEDYIVAEKPTRPYISWAENRDYPSRQALRSQLVINAEKCSRCMRHVAEHTEYFRVMRGSIACREFTSLAKKVA